MFVFALFNLQGTVSSSALAVSLLMLPHSKPFVKNFFQVFSNFFLFCGVSLGFRPSAWIYYHLPLHLSSIIFDFFQKILEALSGLQVYGNRLITECHRSGHNRRRFSYKQRQTCRRYPHPGMRRSYAPAGSSASQLPHGSWV